MPRSLDQCSANKCGLSFNLFTAYRETNLGLLRASAEFSPIFVRHCLALGLRGHTSCRRRPSSPGLSRRQTGQDTVKIILLIRRLLSSNIGKLNPVADRQHLQMAGSVGETVIVPSGDFFAIPFVAPVQRAAGGAL